MATTPDLTTVVVSSLVGGLVSYLGALWKSAVDFHSKVDDGLIAKRTRLYEALWSLTKKVPKWPQNEQLRYTHLRELSVEMQRWYFDEGGIYMSEATRVAYGAAQDTISAVVRAASGGDLDRRVTHEGPSGYFGTDGGDYERVRASLSALRTAMTEDLLSRRGAGRWWPF
jgi:hypothetical protein